MKVKVNQYIQKEKKKLNIYNVALFTQLLMKIKPLNNQVMQSTQEVTMRFGWQYLAK